LPASGDAYPRAGTPCRVAIIGVWVLSVETLLGYGVYGWVGLGWA
jgi:hypothetical protein